MNRLRSDDHYLLNVVVLFSTSMLQCKVENVTSIMAENYQMYGKVIHV